MEFQVNGVTMDFSRTEAIISDQVDFSIFDSFNPFIPNGWHYQNGVQQFVVEFMWYTNYATGEIIPRLGESWEYNDDYTELRLYLRKGDVERRRGLHGRRRGLHAEYGQGPQLPGPERHSHRCIEVLEQCLRRR